MPLNIKLTIEEIYDAVCPKCKEKIIDLAARSASVDIIRKQLEEQWSKKKK